MRQNFCNSRFHPCKDSMVPWIAERILLSLFQQIWRKIDFIRGDKLLAKLNENMLAVDCAEQLVRDWLFSFFLV